MNSGELHFASSFERLHYATMESAEDPAPRACFSSTDIATIPAHYECMEDVGLSTSAVKVLLCNICDTTAAEQRMQKYSAQTNTSSIVKNASKKMHNVNIISVLWRMQMPVVT